MEIITDKKKLQVRCDEIGNSVSEDEVKKIAKEIKKVIYDNNLTNLAANQLGYDLRIIGINFNGDIRIYLNPIIIDSEGLEISKEICSSIKNKKYLIPRCSSVTVAYQHTNGRMESQKFMGLAAREMQHAINHLDGILLSDIGLEIDSRFDKASDQEKDELITAYLKSIIDASKTANDYIESDEELSKMNDAIRFMDKLVKGEITLEKIENKDATESEKVVEEGKGE